MLAFVHSLHFVKKSRILKMLYLYLLGQIFFMPNTVIHAFKNITEKMNLLKMCGPQIVLLCLLNFVVCLRFDPLRLGYNRYSQLTRWCSGNVSALGAIGPSGKGFYV